VVAAALLAEGCSVYQSTGDDVSQAVERWQRQRVAADRPADGKPRNVPPSDAMERPDAAGDRVAGAASPLHRYVTEALTRNPTILAAIADVRAKLERIPQVTALADPVLRAIVRPEPIQTAAGDAWCAQPKTGRRAAKTGRELSARKNRPAWGGSFGVV
jgi:hypothetical protein